MGISGAHELGDPAVDIGSHSSKMLTLLINSPYNERSELLKQLNVGDAWGGRTWK